jgi:hypothetical protein
MPKSLKTGKYREVFGKFSGYTLLHLDTLHKYEAQNLYSITYCNCVPMGVQWNQKRKGARAEQAGSKEVETMKTGTYSLRENFDFLKTFDEKKVFTDTAWVAENDPEVYARLHELMEGFVADESNHTTQEDLESFEAGKWCVEYFFKEDEGEITVSIYAGETWQAVADQPPWLEETISSQEFFEDWPYRTYLEKLED